MSLPIFSFIIPTYNRADIICEALASVKQEQESTGFILEVLVADDFSTDDTQEKIAAWCNTENIPWVYYDKLPKKAGVCAARNNGVERAKGDFLIFLDSDDQILPGALHHIKSIFDTQPDVDIYYGAIQKKSGHLGVLPEESALERLLDFKDYVSLKGIGEYFHVCRSTLLKSFATEDIDKTHLRFCEQINGFETYLWMMTLRNGAKLWIDPKPVRLYDDLRLDRLCHPMNLRHDAKRLAEGFRVFFNEFGESVRVIDYDYWVSLLFRVVFYNKVSNDWSAELAQQLQHEIKQSPIKLRLLVLMPSQLVSTLYPLINKLRESKLLNRLK